MFEQKLDDGVGAGRRQTAGQPARHPDRGDWPGRMLADWQASGQTPVWRRLAATDETSRVPRPAPAATTFLLIQQPARGVLAHATESTKPITAAVRPISAPSLTAIRRIASNARTAPVIGRTSSSGAIIAKGEASPSTRLTIDRTLIVRNPTSSSAPSVAGEIESVLGVRVPFMAVILVAVARVLSFAARGSRVNSHL